MNYIKKIKVKELKEFLKDKNDDDCIDFINTNYYDLEVIDLMSDKVTHQIKLKRFDRVGFFKTTSK